MIATRPGPPPSALAPFHVAMEDRAPTLTAEQLHGAYTAGQVGELREAFFAEDADGDGMLSSDEWRDFAVSAINEHFASLEAGQAKGAQLTRVVSAFDVDFAGVLMKVDFPLALSMLDALSVDMRKDAEVEAREHAAFVRAAAAQGVALVDDAVAFGDAEDDDGSGEEEGAPVTPAPARRRASVSQRRSSMSRESRSGSFSAGVSGQAMHRRPSMSVVPAAPPAGMVVREGVLVPENPHLIERAAEAAEDRDAVREANEAVEQGASGRRKLFEDMNQGRRASQSFQSSGAGSFSEYE